jgi:hypothetical protein
MIFTKTVAEESYFVSNAAKFIQHNTFIILLCTAIPASHSRGCIQGATQAASLSYGRSVYSLSFQTRF